MTNQEDFRRWPEFSKICREASRAIKTYAMLAPGDRVLVGISGGEDSLTLMHVLTYLQKRAPFQFELQAVTVDLEFATLNLKRLGDYCLAQGWDWHNVTIPGQDLLIAKQAEDRPCAMCSRLRRGQLHAWADRQGYNKIALGQQLDDLCVSFLLALFRGGGLKTMGANVAADQGTKRLIRPLCLVEKEKIRRLATKMNYPEVKSCPYQEKLQETGDRFFLEQMLGQLEMKFPNVRSAIRHGLTDVRLAHLLDLRYLDLQGTEKDPDQGKL